MSSRAQSSSPRGFVVLIVLLVLAVISVIAIGQLAVVGNESVSGVRHQQDVEARALAEGCLTELQRNAECFLDKTDLGTPCGSTPNKFAPPYAEPDFDKLLNPNDSALEDGDEYVPQIAGKTVQIPAGSGQSWKLLVRDGGACLVRYEDNSDDDFPAAAVSDDGSSHNCGGPGAEGTGVDIAYCDRDKAIYLTAIGLYPVDASAATVQAVADTAYANAHAHVTLRKLFQAATPSSFPTGIATPGTVTFKNNALLCGAGGITANDVDGSIKGTSCMCGPINTVNPANPPIGSACPCPSPVASCNPGSASSGAQPAPPIDIDGNFDKCSPAGSAAGCLSDPEAAKQLAWVSPLQPKGNNFLGTNGFGDPYANTPVLGAPGANNLSTNVGSAALTSTATPPPICEFYFDIDAANSIYYFDSGDTNTFASLAAHGLALVDSDTPVGESCTNYTQDPVDKPCAWNTTAALAGLIPPKTVSCGANQTACWKLLARLDGTPAQNLDPSAPEPTTFSGSEELVLKSSTLLPFAGSSKNEFSAAGASNLCGAPASDTTIASCSNCDGTHASIDAPGVGGAWRFHTVNNNTMPVPFIAVIDGSPTLTNLGAGASPPLPLFATFLVSGSPDIGPTGTTSFGLCCAECDCTGVGAVNIDPSSPQCDHVVPETKPWVFYPAAGAPSARPAIPGFAIKADGSMNLDISGSIVGVTWVGGNSTLSGRPCVSGRYVVGGNLNVSGASTGAQFLDDICVVGDVDASNSVTMRANLWVEGKVTAKNSFKLIGRVYADGDVTFKNSARILWDGGGAGGSFGSSALSSFMESQW